MNHSIASLLLRLSFGGIMLFSHGLPKLQNFSNMMNTFPDPLGVGSSLSLGLAIFAEVLCALLITLGLFTRMAVIPLAITMFVAVFVVHSNDPWSKMEFGFLYLMAYAALFFLDSGKFSLDRIVRKKG